MIQDESSPTMNIKVEVHHISFPKSPRKLHLSKELWRSQHGLLQLFCKTVLGHFLQYTIFESIAKTKTTLIQCITYKTCNLDQGVKRYLNWIVGFWDICLEFKGIYVKQCIFKDNTLFSQDAHINNIKNDRGMWNWSIHS